MANLNTSETIMKKGKKSTKQLDVELARGVEEFSKDLIEFSVPKALAKRLGSPLYVGVNGVTVGIDVDGEKYKIPKAHADRIMEIISNLN